MKPWSNPIEFDPKQIPRPILSVPFYVGDKKQVGDRPLFIRSPSSSEVRPQGTSCSVLPTCWGCWHSLPSSHTWHFSLLGWCLHGASMGPWIAENARWSRWGTWSWSGSPCCQLTPAARPRHATTKHQPGSWRTTTAMGEEQNGPRETLRIVKTYWDQKKHQVLWNTECGYGWKKLKISKLVRFGYLAHGLWYDVMLHDPIWLHMIAYPIGSMYGIYGNIYHQYTPNVSIYTIHGSYGYDCINDSPQYIGKIGSLLYWISLAGVDPTANAHLAIRSEHDWDMIRCCDSLRFSWDFRLRGDTNIWPGGFRDEAAD